MAENEIPIPFSPEAEAGVLGAILMNNAVYHRIAAIISAEHFYEPLHRVIWEAIVARIEQNLLATAVTIKGDLSHLHPDLAIPQYLGQLIVNSFDGMFARDYALNIKELWARRTLIEVGNDMASVASHMDPGESAIQILASDVYARVESVTENLQDAKVGRSMIGDAANDVFVSLNTNEFDPGISIGLESVHDKLGGMKGGDLVIMAARPGMGKTTLMLSSALAMGGASLGVGIFSIEMGRDSLAMRALAEVTARNRSPVHYSWIGKGKVNVIQEDALRNATGYLCTMPIVIDDRRPITCAQIGVAARQMRNNFEARGLTLGCIFVDHLGLIEPSQTYRGNKVAETGEISGALKTLAKVMGIPVVALCQLSREVERREDKRPMLSDLRWAGEIEQDADKVIMLYREHYYLEKVSRGTDDAAIKAQGMLAMVEDKLEILIEKNRNGQTGMVEVYCDIATGLIRDR